MNKICMQFMSLNIQGTSKSRPKDDKLKKEKEEKRGTHNRSVLIRGQSLSPCLIEL